MWYQHFTQGYRNLQKSSCGNTKAGARPLWRWLLEHASELPIRGARKTTAVAIPKGSQCHGHWCRHYGEGGQNGWHERVSNGRTSKVEKRIDSRFQRCVRKEWPSEKNIRGSRKAGNGHKRALRVSIKGEGQQQEGRERSDDVTTAPPAYDPDSLIAHAKMSNAKTKRNRVLMDVDLGCWEHLDRWPDRRICPMSVRLTFKRCKQWPKKKLP